MWKPPVNFITLHYTYIIFCSLLGIVILYPYGNLSAIDAFFFGVSSATVSGLNVVNLKDLKTYQQLFLYFIPTICNMCFTNILVVIVRLHWFEKRLKETAPTAFRPSSRSITPKEYDYDQEEQHRKLNSDDVRHLEQTAGERTNANDEHLASSSKSEKAPEELTVPKPPNSQDSDTIQPLNRRISFVDNNKALYIPSPRERDRGQPIVEVDERASKDEISEYVENDDSKSEFRRRLRDANPLERVASSLFVLGSHPSRTQGSQLREAVSLSKSSNLPTISAEATLGRNSKFYNLTAEDRERLGGIEYRGLKILLKTVIGYFFGLHLIGAICLVGWIQYAGPKYRDYLKECGQNHIWWGFYAAQTMANNLGFTLTPDSMISFRDATFPMLVMTFLAYAGNNLYPVFLRLIIWTMYKCTPKNSSFREPLDYLLKYPRRCYTLLFRSKPTWVLFGIIFVLNFVDVLLILVLDLHNPAVNTLHGGPRVLAAIFQAASARHTGTTSFDLASVNPAVQFSLLVMMYISVFPIAISIRASNTYEEQSLGIFASDGEVDESNTTSYVLSHVRNQLSFDLWYIFLGIFCICVAESNRIMSPAEPGLSVFAIFFEVISAYANVGLSLGYPGASTALSGELSTFSKVVICLMMIRGKNRGLPHQVDRAIHLPSERLVDDQVDSVSDNLYMGGKLDPMDVRDLKVKRYHTK
ncbi:cation transport protein-domain-containing protein [Aspergillus bertholletiae]|uniref:Cation transport protein-domain-containing protein n=1 Tax=Aspergillus bertholletiae TaxID=1226010 RepID=A0A5N7BD15_9EURO|nr:cation transport protein-domain-containing protein [Aspergillus bertholletiae]